VIARLGAMAIVDLALIALATAGVAPRLCLTGHVLLAIAALVLWLRDGRMPGVAPAIAGVAGPVALLAALPLTRLAIRGATAAEDDEPAADTPPMAPLSGKRMLDGRVHHSAPEDLGSLVTILHHGSVADRRVALETAVRAFRPALSPLLAIALTDGDQTIRALAAAAAARIAQNLATTRAALEARGDDTSAAWTLAALLAEHARDNVLLSDSQRAHLRDDALAIVARLPTPAPNVHAGLHDAALAEALWAAGDYDGIDRLGVAWSA
jgi:hypothetical protein